jgi:hypothetical protein
LSTPFFPKTNFPGIPLRNSAKVLAMAFRPLPRCEPWGTGVGCFVLLVWCFSLSAPCANRGYPVPGAERGCFASGAKCRRSVAGAGRGTLAHSASHHAPLTMGAWPTGATGGALAHSVRRRATAACAEHSRIAAYAGGGAVSWATRGSAGRIAAFAGGGG